MIDYKELDGFHIEERVQKYGLPYDQFSALCRVLYGIEEKRFKMKDIRKKVKQALWDAITTQGTGSGNFEERLSNVLKYVHIYKNDWPNS